MDRRNRDPRTPQRSPHITPHGSPNLPAGQAGPAVPPIEIDARAANQALQRQAFQAQLMESQQQAQANAAAQAAHAAQAGAQAVGAEQNDVPINQENWMKLVRHVESLEKQVTDANNALSATVHNLNETKAELQEVRARGTGKAKANRPSSFTGKGTKIEVWIAQMDTYVEGENPETTLRVAISYIEGDAFSWLESFRLVNEINTWEQLKEALVRRFSPLDKAIAARDKLHRWKQVKDVESFNSDFMSILIDIPDIAEAEKLDRYSRGLKSYIWEALCTKTYQRLEDLMTDALRVENAKRGRHQKARVNNGSSSNSHVTPMELGSTSIQKLTPAEREKCLREGRCLRCRRTGHMARDCPKGQRRVPTRGTPQ